MNSDEQHAADEACFFCATDEELAGGIAGRPPERTIYFQLRPDQCPHETADAPDGAS